MTPQQRRSVVDALLSDEPDQARLYRTSPTFRQGVDQMVAMLPLFLAGLAGQASAADADARMRMVSVTYDPPPPVIIPVPVHDPRRGAR